MGLVRAIQAISALGVWTARWAARSSVPSLELWVLNKAFRCAFSQSSRQLRSGMGMWHISRVNPEPTPERDAQGMPWLECGGSHTPSACACAGAGVIVPMWGGKDLWGATEPGLWLQSPSETGWSPRLT